MTAPLSHFFIKLLFLHITRGANIPLTYSKYYRVLISFNPPMTIVYNTYHRSPKLFTAGIGCKEVRIPP